MGLPKPVLLRRISKELQDCTRYLGSDFSFDVERAEFPIKIDMHMSNVVGYDRPDHIITEHQFTIILTEEYGFKKPEVRWRSEIFHPNILGPKDGGYVCLKMLNDWSFETSLLSFLKSVESLVMEPNPSNPFGTDSCMAAADYFSNNKSKFNAKIEYGVK
ncbi:MAG: hypothetical protein IJF47_06750 [Candidatus Methanomethylophilaceae archaeon]|nr:hypothetical protein [Thermoplasmata archaeon]MBQ2763384.1 hypothetical protein [Candidatus Methanomethylophilaceae archaeon]